MPNLHVNGAEFKGARLGLNIFVFCFLLYMGYLMVTGEFNTKVEDVYAAFRDPCTAPGATCTPAPLPSQLKRQQLQVDDGTEYDQTDTTDDIDELPARRRPTDGMETDKVGRKTR
jgi:hypothetical protein